MPLISAFLYIFWNTNQVLAEVLPSCPRFIRPQWRGPYVIKPSATTPPCHADQQPAMMSCMQQCQADVCCRAFGLDAAGKCVTSNITTETLHFVKETPDPVELTCFQDFCNQCENGAACVLQGDQPVCECRVGFDGTLCQTDLCTVDRCLNGAKCQFLADVQECVCISGFSGPRCEIVGSHTVLPSDGELAAYMNDMYDEGDWGSYEACSTGSYAAGIQLTIHFYQDNGDDTAVTVIRLLCKQAWGGFLEVSNVTSATMPWGDMQPKVYCPSDYWIVAFRLYYEPALGSFSDDTGVNGMQVMCRGPGIGGINYEYIEQTKTYSNSKWSSWSSICAPRSAVCALKTRVEPDQDSSWGIDIDDAAVTDARLYCCEY